VSCYMPLICALCISTYAHACVYMVFVHFMHALRCKPHDWTDCTSEKLFRLIRLVHINS
jgi:hypothetical protein